MNKYKSLITILVVFSSIQFIVTGAVAPIVQKWVMKQSVEGGNLTNQFSYMLSIIQYATALIWLPVSVWIYNDSKKIMFTPWLWAILILTAHYQGLIIYLLIQIIMDKEKVEMTTLNMSDIT